MVVQMVVRDCRGCVVRVPTPKAKARWLRQAVLKLHRLADDWPELQRRVNAFLDQFATGSHDLLRYVGLLGDGRFAQALRVA